MTIRGKPAIVLIFSLVLAMVALGLWFNVQKTRRALELWGPTAGSLIARAPSIEVLQIEPGSEDVDLSAEPLLVNGQRPIITESKEVNRARGLPNLRRALVEDISFEWDSDAEGGDPIWQLGLRFVDGDQTATVLFAPNSRRLLLLESGVSATIRPELAKELESFASENLSRSP